MQHAPHLGISFWTHYPQHHVFNEENLKRMSPDRRERAEKHIARMTKIVKDYMQRVREYWDSPEVREYWKSQGREY